MRKLFVCVLMIAVIGAFSSLTYTPTLAQTTKKEKDKDKDKDAKKDKDTKKPAGGVIEVVQGAKDGKFRFFVRDADGKLLAMCSPSGFASEKDAKEAIDDLKDVLRTAKVTTKKADK